MHGTSVARALGCRQVYIPRQAGAFCAVGMLNSDVRQDFLKVYLADFADTGPNDLATGFADLEDQATAFLAAEGFSEPARALVREIDLRYRSQLWSIRVNLGDGGLDAAAIQTATTTTVTSDSHRMLENSANAAVIPRLITTASAFAKRCTNMSMNAFALYFSSRVVGT